mmetsp:Transcript_15494/g.32118  ORF Transcript_15494/g.32118 Transcript_15494/m.32118 type:complete len:524 (-) Transcript_15494:362-1933(-)
MLLQRIQFRSRGKLSWRLGSHHLPARVRGLLLGSLRNLSLPLSGLILATAGVLFAHGLLDPVAHHSHSVTVRAAIKGGIAEVGDLRHIDRRAERLVEKSSDEQVESSHWLVLWHHVPAVVDCHEGDVSIKVLHIPAQLGIDFLVVQKRAKVWEFLLQKPRGGFLRLKEPRSPFPTSGDVETHGIHRGFGPPHLHARVSIPIVDHNIADVAGKLLVYFDHAGVVVRFAWGLAIKVAGPVLPGVGQVIREERPGAQRIRLHVEGFHHLVVGQVLRQHLPKVIIVWTPRVIRVNEASVWQLRVRAVAISSGGSEVVHSPSRSAGRSSLVWRDDAVHVASDAVVPDVLMVLRVHEALAHGKLEVEVQVAGEGLRLVIGARIAHSETQEVQVQRITCLVHELGQRRNVDPGVRLAPYHKVPALELRELLLDEVHDRVEVQLRSGRVVVLARLSVHHRIAVRETDACWGLEIEHVCHLVPRERVGHQRHLAVDDEGPKLRESTHERRGSWPAIQPKDKRVRLRVLALDK